MKTVTSWKNYTIEEEERIFDWLAAEIVLCLKKGETRGFSNLNYLTKIKLQKIIFQVCEDCSLDLTRMWYMFGGIVLPPFEFLDRVQEYYHHTRSSQGLRKVNFFDKSLINKVKENLNKNFKEIFYKKTEDVLTTFYEKNAPSLYRELYSNYRSIRTLYFGVTSTKTRLDFYLRALIPNFSPWKDVVKLQHYISDFQVEVAGIFDDEDDLKLIIDFTRLIENVAIQISWLKSKNERITKEHENAINNLMDEFTNRVWKLLATTIGTNTIRGANAKFWLEKLLSRKKYLKGNAQDSLNTLENQLTKMKLQPNLKVLENFFQREYQKMIDEALGEMNELEDETKSEEIINKC